MLPFATLVSLCARSPLFGSLGAQPPLGDIAGGVPPCSTPVPSASSCSLAFHQFLAGGDFPSIQKACAAQGSVCSHVRDYMGQRIWGWVVRCNSASSFLKLASQCEPSQCPNGASDPRLDEYLAYVLARARSAPGCESWTYDYPGLVDPAKTNATSIAANLYGEASHLLVDYVLMQLQTSCLTSAAIANRSLDELQLKLAGPPEYPFPALSAFEMVPEIAALGLFALLTLETAATVAQPNLMSTIRANIRTGSYGPHVTAVLSAWQNDRPCASPPPPSPESPAASLPPPPSPCTGGTFQACEATCSPLASSFQECIAACLEACPLLTALEVQYWALNLTAPGDRHCTVDPGLWTRMSTTTQGFDISKWATVASDGLGPMQPIIDCQVNVQQTASCSWASPSWFDTIASKLHAAGQVSTSTTSCTSQCENCQENANCYNALGSGVCVYSCYCPSNQCKATLVVNTGTELASWMNRAGSSYLKAGMAANPVTNTPSVCNCAGGHATDCNGDQGCTISSGCHPSASTILLADGSWQRMDTIRPGVIVLTPSGPQPVIGFLHAEEDGLFAYVRLDTRDGSLAISKEHWLFANGKESSPARIARGDYIHSPAGEVAVESVRKTVEVGAFHPLVAGGAYFADGVLVSDYNDHVPRVVWRVVRAYAHARFSLGVPVIPQGFGFFRDPFWAFEVLDDIGISSETQMWFFPLLVPTALLTELVNLGAAGLKTRGVALHTSGILALFACYSYSRRRPNSHSSQRIHEQRMSSKELGNVCS